MGLDDLSDAIKSRRSIRKWEDREVSEDLLLEAVELATWAPNAGNQQNWHFYIILNRDTIKAIADAVQASTNLMASWPGADKFINVERTRDRAAFFRSAPAAIAVASSRYRSGVEDLCVAQGKTDLQARQIRRWRNTADSRIQSAASAIAYLLLVLHQKGLGAVWMTGPMQAKKEIEKILRVPRGLDVVAFIPIGYPAETPPPGRRRAVREACDIIK